MGQDFVTGMVRILLFVLQGPWWSMGLMACFLAIGLWGLTPLDSVSIREATSWDIVKTRIRRVALMALLVVFAPMPWFAGMLFCDGLSGATVESCSQMTDFRNSLYWRGLYIGVASLAGGWALGLLWARVVYTHISHLSRKMRYRVSDESMTDIRALAGKVKGAAYDPRKYYDREMMSIFVGLNEEGKRVMLSRRELEGKHLEVIGPTGFGKGVVVGTMIDQLIRMNARSDTRNVVIAIMPKQDLWLPHIMSQAAAAVNCRFRFFDMLSRERGGGWAPLAAGTPEEKRTRLMIMLGMGETGSDADFYKLGEKRQIDAIMDEHQDSSLEKLRNRLQEAGKAKGATAAVRAIDTLNEFCRLDTFTAPADRAGLNIPRILESDEPEIVYVNSSLTHETVLKMTKALIAEITQQGMSLWAQGRRKTHVWLFVDELRFLVSETFDKAAATVGMYGMNIVAAYQSPTDLEKSGDKTINGRAIAHSVHTNMQVKLIYRVAEGDQARWAAEQTGTKWISITGREEAEADRFGSEKWSQKRSIQKVKDYHISENELKALPKRVGVLIAPERLAQLVYTAHVPVEQKEDFYSPVSEGRRAKRVAKANGDGGGEFGEPAQGASSDEKPEKGEEAPESYEIWGEDVPEALPAELRTRENAEQSGEEVFAKVAERLSAGERSTDVAEPAGAGDGEKDRSGNQEPGMYVRDQKDAVKEKSRAKGNGKRRNRSGVSRVNPESDRAEKGVAGEGRKLREGSSVVKKGSGEAPA